MKTKHILTCIIALSLAVGARAQGGGQTAFGAGEKLTFVISYRAKVFPNTDIAEVVFRTSDAHVAGNPAYHIHATATVYPFYKWFYDLNDTYETWLAKATLKPLKHSFRLREAKYRVNCNYVYDWANRRVVTEFHNLKKPNARVKTLPLTDHSYDALALFYNLRNDDPGNYVAGRTRTLELVLDDTVRRVNYKYLGREANKNISGLGRFNTLKFSCQLATSSGESFEDGSEFFLWISDDRNRIPLYIESPIKVGSIRGRLSKYEGLGHPLDSKVK